ncbi:uncharacterized mitochondrial protein AtMg00810-like [Aristolochia californica]|uniref:uncharacterized mitochondrial protein AtMg00810-like n=1 Tax=Aristolochia californica TaxID=171875 RepID=UPI0035DD705E
MCKPQLSHWQAFEKILRYMKGAPGRGLPYKNHGHFNIERFSDAEWAGSLDDKKSTFGFYTMVGANLVTWKSKKQNLVARSSAEVEYRAMSYTLEDHVGPTRVRPRAGLLPYIHITEEEF